MSVQGYSSSSWQCTLLSRLKRLFRFQFFFPFRLALTIVRFAATTCGRPQPSVMIAGSTKSSKLGYLFSRSFCDGVGFLGSDAELGLVTMTRSYVIYLAPSL